MNGTWHIVNLIVLVIYSLWLPLAFISWRRLTGDQGRLNAKICLAVYAVYEIPHLVGDIFEIAEAKKVALFSAAVGVVIAMILQVWMLRNPSEKDTKTEVESLVRLKLS